MTGRTHDLAAFTAINYIFITQPIQHMSLATVFVAFGANMIGGLTPDIDQSTADLWMKLPAGSVFGKLLSPLLGGHRFISHSVIGILLFGFLSQKFLDSIHSILLVDMHLVWISFMVGFVSHLVMDTFTREGVPWLFPIPIHFGIPPLKFLRIKTGGIIEKSLVFPGLLIANGYLLFNHYTKYLDFLKHYIK